MLTMEQLWNQLGLQARLVDRRDTSTEPDSASLQQYSFHLDVSHARDDEELDVRNAHRLLSGVPASDIKPPPAVVILPLHAIHLTIGISNNSTSQSLRGMYVREDVRSCLGPFVADAQGQSNETVFDDDEILIDIEPIEVIEDKPSTHCRTMQISEVSSYQPPPREPDRPPKDQVSHDSFSLEIQGLLDAAFRLSICDKPQKLMKGIRVKSEDLETRLAEVSPSLFSPGHSKAVAQRSCFVPTIAHALSKKLPQSARSESLRRKLDQLSSAPNGCHEFNNSARSSLNGSESSRPSVSERYRSVSARLWQFLQTSLRDERAARRLKPIVGPSTYAEIDDDLFEQESEEPNEFVDQPDECIQDFADEEDSDLFEHSFLESEFFEDGFDLLDTTSDEGDSCDDLFDASTSQQYQQVEHKLTTLFDIAPPDATSHDAYNSAPSTDPLLEASSPRLHSTNISAQGPSQLLSCASISPIADIPTPEYTPAPFSMSSEPHCGTTAPRRHAARPCIRHEHEETCTNAYTDTSLWPLDSYTGRTDVDAYEDFNAITGVDADEEMMDAGDEDGEDGADEMYSSGNESGVMLEEDEGYVGSQEISCPWVVSMD